MVIPSSSMANEMLRIAGMGGTRIATSADDAGIFGNPASLVSVKHHNLALGIAAENLHWTELPKQGREQFVAEANIDLYPSVYYSQAFGEWGVSAGYTSTSTNFADFISLLPVPNTTLMPVGFSLKPTLSQIIPCSVKRIGCWDSVVRLLDL